MLYRCVDAVDRFNSVTSASAIAGTRLTASAEGSRAGLINKATLNAIDEKMLQRIGNGKVLVVESQVRSAATRDRFRRWSCRRRLVMVLWAS